MTDPAPAQAGHNSGDAPDSVLVGEALATGLEARTKSFAERRLDLIQRGEVAPQEIETEEQFEIVRKIAVDTTAYLADLNKDRVAVKAPYLASTQVIDNLYNDTLTDRLRKMKTFFENAGGKYQKAKADRLRDEARQRETEERLKADALAAKAAEAAISNNVPEANALVEDLTTATAAAQEAEQTATAPDAELGKSYTGGGKVAASMRTVWTYSITDIARVDLEKLRPYLDSDAIGKALQRYVTTHKENAAMDGVNFQSEQKAQYR